MICHRFKRVSQVLSQVCIIKSAYDSVVSQVSQVSQVFRARIRARGRAHLYLLPCVTPVTSVTSLF